MTQRTEMPQVQIVPMQAFIESAPTGEELLA